MPNEPPDKPLMQSFFTRYPIPVSEEDIEKINAYLAKMAKLQSLMMGLAGVDPKIREESKVEAVRIQTHFDHIVVELQRLRSQLWEDQQNRIRDEKRAELFAEMDARDKEQVASVKAGLTERGLIEADDE